ncbi:discoidin domain-containing protein [[Mycoplasma] testudinis]|uniref:discoidin domain-containing protein n=1 Tax=[Mycoplasma] testudinis TaxID=33924 RepID=UPI00048A426A|nr:discoidin domain-containing protein [[Mycoplasma] testudinis]
MSNSNPPKKLMRFNVKAWTAIWAGLGVVGAVVIVAPTAWYQINQQPLNILAQQQLEVQQKRQRQITGYYQELLKNSKFTVNNSEGINIASNNTLPDDASVVQFASVIAVNTPVPSISVDLNNLNFSLFFHKQTTDNDSGSIQLKAILKQTTPTGDIYYDATGRVTEDLQTAGVDVSLSGYSKSTNLVDNFYNAIQNLNATAAESKTSSFVKDISVSDNPSLDDVNALMSSPIPTLPLGLSNAGFAVSFTKGAINPNDGSITINAFLKKDKMVYDRTGEINNSYAGTPFTINGFNKPPVNNPTSFTNTIESIAPNQQFTIIPYGTFPTNLSLDFVMNNFVFSASTSGSAMGTSTPYNYAWVKNSTGSTILYLWQETATDFKGVEVALTVQDGTLMGTYNRAISLSKANSANSISRIANIDYSNPNVISLQNYGISNLKVTYPAPAATSLRGTIGVGVNNGPILEPKNFTPIQIDYSDNGGTNDVGRASNSLNDNNDTTTYARFVWTSGARPSFLAGDYISSDLGRLYLLKTIHIVNGAPAASTVPHFDLEQSDVGHYWRNYRIDVSTDGSNWVSVKQGAATSNGAIDIDVSSSNIYGRYIRFVTTANENSWLVLMSFNGTGVAV